MRTRGYRTGDVEAMFLLDLVCFATPYQFDRLMMAEVAETPGAIVVIVEDDAARMLGFVIAHIEGRANNRYAYIVTIDVSPIARQQGAGTNLLQHAELQAHAAGARRVALHVAIENVAAIRFYERQKYVKVGLAERFYREAGADAFLYSKQLPKPGAP